MLGLKYRNCRHVALHVAGVLAQRLAATGVDVDVVTWAPTSTARRRRRGFDQAEILARAVAAHLGLPCRRLLERDGTTPAQTGRGRRDRLSGPRFRVHPRAAGRRVLVVDDVVTTGATLDSARRWLRQAAPPTSCSPPSQPRRTACYRRDGPPKIAGVARWGGRDDPRGPWISMSGQRASDVDIHGPGTATSSRRVRVIAVAAAVLSVALCGAVAQASSAPDVQAGAGKLVARRRRRAQGGRYPVEQRRAWRPTCPRVSPSPPDDLGDDPQLDELATACFEGDLLACDHLYLQSPVDSDYEEYGDTCGGRQSAGTGATAHSERG